MRIDYIQIGPDLENNNLNRVIFLSETRYYMQTYATILFSNTNPQSSLVNLDTQTQKKFKGIIYSSEQLNACYQLSSNFLKSDTIMAGGSMDKVEIIFQSLNPPISF
jgi:hypothetical protein